MTPKVSIIIPFYNDPFIGQAIESALGQSYGNIEVIVVDDGSTSNQHLIAPYMHRIVYLGKANAGTASALNYGIQSASGKYVAWLSSDDRFYPDKVNNQVIFMESVGAQISHTDYDVINEHNAVTAHRAGLKYPTAKAFIQALRQGCPVNGCTVMMTKKIVEEIGYFNPGLPYTHDYELWIRMVLCRIDFHYLNEPLTAYRRHTNMGTVRHFDRIMDEAGSVNRAFAPLMDTLIAQLPD
ncbi:glycosyltransferase [Paenibacillus methanolicus]|uniref:Glycosyltransferase involved in cell wall biosynthesis n=1 Tax=Paenibacillus methanolicus TaxID=582686 RepID=A0A5S5BUH3_9BACL|nr:glycosyltransferase [Paenibacillus methanolicus]TYP69862.1 glycosyltransferase involved in cell wall biosynthesis [Paenibacillus methanolicus]